MSPHTGIVITADVHPQSARPETRCQTDAKTEAVEWLTAAAMPRATRNAQDLISVAVGRGTPVTSARTICARTDAETERTFTSAHTVDQSSVIVRLLIAMETVSFESTVFDEIDIQ
jgi:hypothetical protein